MTKEDYKRYEELWWKIFDCPYKGKCNIPKGIFPAPFFVGDNYERVANKVLFIAQNPGWPHYKVKKNNDYNKFPDCDYTEIQKNLTHAGSKYKDNFYFLMQAYVWELRVDNVWRGLIKSGIKAQLKNIAYTNLAKCPTFDNDFPTDKMIEECVKYLKSEIDLLKPSHVIFIGKGTYDTYSKFKNSLYTFLRNKGITWFYHTSMPVWQKKNREVRRKEITYINGFLKNKYWR